jgi:hypothetical protein
MMWFTRITGGILWLAAIALTIALVYEFTSSETANSVVTGIAGLAIAISAIGLAFARYAWQRRAYPEIALGVAMWLAGFVCLSFIEVSYWVSSYQERYAQYLQDKKARERHEVKSDRAWNALMSGDMPATSAQLAAQIEAKKLEYPIVRSAMCAQITRGDSRQACQELFSLQAQFAKAKERERLEGMSTAVPQAVAGKHIANNVFAFAEILAKWRGGEVLDWAYVIMLWNWILLTLVRDAGFLVMNPLGRVRKPVAAERPEAILPSEKVGQRAPRPALTPREDVLALMAGTVKQNLTVEPTPEEITPPDGGGTKAPEPLQVPDAESNPVVAQNATTVVAGPWPEKPTRKAKSGLRKLDEQHQSIMDAFIESRYVEDEMTIEYGKRVAGGISASDFRHEYERYCKDSGHPFVRGSHAGRYVAAAGFEAVLNRSNNKPYYPLTKRVIIPQKKRASA